MSRTQPTSGFGPRVLIVVPARDEARRLEPCLRALRVAVTTARQADCNADAVIAVAAHRCCDASETIARAALGPGHLVFPVSIETTVGAVRAAAVDRAVGQWGPPDWLFSTDADTQVPPDWICDVLRLGQNYDAVAGLIELDELPTHSPTVLAHDRLVDAGLRPDGTHTHVYGANLAVRWSSYRAAGGFPDVGYGEDAELVARVRETGGRVLATSAVRVRTSGRLHGRARHGLADLLSDLAVGLGRD